jgi:hypothetical protein
MPPEQDELTGSGHLLQVIPLSTIIIDRFPHPHEQSMIRCNAHHQTRLSGRVEHLFADKAHLTYRHPSRATLVPMSRVHISMLKEV